MTQRYSSLFVLLLCVAACSGGGTTSPAPKPTATSTPVSTASPSTTSSPKPTPSSVPTAPPVSTASPPATPTPTPFVAPTAPPLLSGLSFRYYSFNDSQPSQIVTASDGNVWFTQTFFGEIAYLSPSGATVSYPVIPGDTTKANPIGITVGSDGTLWTADENANSISNLSLSGAQRWVLPTGSIVGPYYIAFGSDGNL